MRTTLIICLFASSVVCAAERPPLEIPDITEVPPQARPSNHFDVEAATQAYLDKMPAAAKARSDAYFEGGYWLLLWNFLYGAGVSLLLLELGWSARMRRWAQRVTRFSPIHTAAYWVQLAVALFILGAPLSIYADFYREHQYGLGSDTFAHWTGDQLKTLMVLIIAGCIVLPLLFGLVRRLPKTWWMWGAGVCLVFAAIGALLAPVLIFPLFNNPKRLEDPKVTAPILKLAHANGIPVDDVFEIDASKQTTRMSANVSGLGSTMRVTLNDNLLHRASPEEIQGVMGHEMGHYVLNHVYKFMMFLSVFLTGVFGFLHWALGKCLARWGARWDILGMGDLAVLPLVSLLVSLVFFALTPVLNTFTRATEYEADMYGINASRQPDGFAQAALHLGEYRKMDPGPLEEFIFYDHPSGRTRIHAAMRWKAENLP